MAGPGYKSENSEDIISVWSLIVDLVHVGIAGGVFEEEGANHGDARLFGLIRQRPGVRFNLKNLARKAT